MPKRERGRGRGRPVILTLTDAQKRLLAAIEAFIGRHGMSPTMREMAEELDQGVANIFKLVQRLERNGYLTRVAGKSRSLAVVRSANDEPIPDLTPVPLVGTVVAGHPLLAQENVLGELLVDSATVRSGRHFALKVNGQSMIDAGIASGDIVIVRQQPLADHRDIVVALLNDEATVKRLHYRLGQVSLLPENARFKPIPVGPDDNMQIIGKVVAIRRKASSLD